LHFLGKRAEYGGKENAAKKATAKKATKNSSKSSPEIYTKPELREKVKKIRRSTKILAKV
jgi:hypothetical protein